jgi:hypothetical protein
MTTRCIGADGSSASNRNDARAAASVAVYSSSSVSPSEYHSRNAAVTAYAVVGGGPISPAANAARRSGNVEGT